jgi:hypothetical protein
MPTGISAGLSMKAVKARAGSLLCLEKGKLAGEDVEHPAFCWTLAHVGTRFVFSGEGASRRLHHVTMDPDIWRGSSGGASFIWNASTLIARDKAGATHTLFTASDDDLGCLNRCPIYSEHSVLSVVGTIASYRTRSNGDVCDDLCGDGVEWKAEDLAREELQLTDLFSAKELFQALIKDRALRKLLSPPLPADLEALGAAVGTSHRGLLDAFAFHHLERGRVGIRILLSATDCPDRDDPDAHPKRMQLGVLLPIPDKLRLALELAQRKQQGFLMHDAEAVAKGRSTRVEAPECDAETGLPPGTESDDDASQKDAKATAGRRQDARPRPPASAPAGSGR